MLKSLRKHPIALVALFLSLGGTSYAVAPIPQGAGATPAYASVWFVHHNHKEQHVEADKSAGLTAANLSYGADNAVCVNGLAKPPRNLQVTSSSVHLTSVQIAPTNGACAGKQARIAFYNHDGSPTIYGSFYMTVIS
jgi:hypothetical protein